MARSEGINRFLGKTVDVTVDRPLGSPLEGGTVPWPLNEGYVDGTVSGIGEPLTAYVVGTGQPVEQVLGKVVAVVERRDDLDDRLVVLAEGPDDWTETDLAVAVHFTEHEYDSYVHTATGRTRRVADLRVAVKAIVRDDERVLLVRYGTGADCWWTLPGGAIAPDETEADALRRELGEELDVTEPFTSSAAWLRSCDFDIDGRRYHQLESIHEVVLDADGVATRRTAAAIEEGITEIRWWTLDALDHLDATADVVYPNALARRLRVPPGLVPRHIRG